MDSKEDKMLKLLKETLNFLEALISFILLKPVLILFRILNSFFAEKCPECGKNIEYGQEVDGANFKFCPICDWRSPEDDPADEAT
jgi:hypothetical protein